MNHLWEDPLILDPSGPILSVLNLPRLRIWQVKSWVTRRIKYNIPALIFMAFEIYSSHS